MTVNKGVVSSHERPINHLSLLLEFVVLHVVLHGDYSDDLLSMQNM